MDITQALGIEISEDQMYAHLNLIDVDAFEVLIEERGSTIKEDLLDWLDSYNIQFGIQTDEIDSVMNQFDASIFPLLIAEGIQTENGIDGKVDFKVDHAIRMVLHEHDDINFKDIMKIPMVEPGDLIAVIQEPSEGSPGKNIYGVELPPKAGKPAQILAGVHTSESGKPRSIYASDFGQVSLINQEIKVLPLYEVSSSLDLSTGNIDFNGSILIRGDVPEGFMVKAKGDITIEGLVEGADVTAGGSIYIKEGVSAVGKGSIRAGVDLITHHINQGNVHAGRDIKVEQSIVHSEVEAEDSVYCQKGSIIGGTISAGAFVVCRDIGNRMHTLTKVFLGEHRSNRVQRLNASEEIKQLDSELKKLKTLEDALNNKQNLTSKEKVMLEKQHLIQNEKKLRLDDLLQKYKTIPNEDEENKFMKVLIHGMLYPNVEIVAGKYSKRFNSGYKQLTVSFEESDFKLEAL